MIVEEKFLEGYKILKRNLMLLKIIDILKSIVIEKRVWRTNWNKS